MMSFRFPSPRSCISYVMAAHMGIGMGRQKDLARPWRKRTPLSCGRQQARQQGRATKAWLAWHGS